MKNTSKRMLSILLVLSMLLGVFAMTASAAEPSAANVYELTVNDLVTPMGIDDPNPSFSWKMASNAIGAAQSAYQIVVTDPKGTTMWDTGWVASNDSVAIEYAGDPLASSTEYTVAVKIQDQDGKETAAATTTFETALMEENAFADTQWISQHESGAKALTTYTIDLDFTVRRYAMGFSFGMTDESNLVMWQFNLSSTNARLRPHVRTNGSWSASNYNLTQTSASLLNKALHMTIEVKGTTVNTYLGEVGAEAALINTHTLSKAVPLNNIGIRAYGAKNETTDSNLEMSAYDNIVIKNGDGDVVYSEDFSGTDPVRALTSGADGHAIVDGVLEIQRVHNNNQHFYLLSTGGGVLNDASAPIFRKAVDVKDGLVSAKLYTSGLGVYENYINGTRVGHLQDDGSMVYDELKPASTLYASHIYYSSFDVTNLLAENQENVLSAIVTSGWWNSGNRLITQGEENAYFAKLILTYEDGTREVVNTDTTWKASKGGPVLNTTGIYRGERYDATQATDWMYPDYDDSDWSKAVVNEEPVGDICAWKGTPTRIWEEKELAPKQLYTYSGVTGNSSTAYGTIVKDETYTDGQDIPLKKGQTLVVDFGQNAAGWEALTFTAPAGTTIRVLHGEMLNDGNGDTSRNMNGPEGSVRVSSSGANHTTTYKTGTDETVTYHPSFTYYGYRCIQITADADVVFHKIRSQLLTSVQEDNAGMVTSDKDVNQLLSNINWSMYSNYLSIPTDCPQRAERLGWTADTQVFSIAGLILANAKPFLEKFMTDVVDAQQGLAAEVGEDSEYYGTFTATAPWPICYMDYDDGSPNYNWVGGTGWADGGVIVPYNIYKLYDDTRIIEQVWDAMVMYMDDYLADRAYGPEQCWNDWMAYESQSTANKQMLALSFYCWDAKMMAEMAEAIGETEAAAKYQQVYAERKAQYQQEFLAADGSLANFSQCTALYALYLDLLPNEESVAAVTKQLIDNVEACGNRLQTGFLGTAIFLPTLTKIGRSDVAYRLLLQHENPSWLFAVDNGATTTWERWNTYSYEVGFPTTSMSSMNHYAYGSVAGWMYQGMAGIGIDENGAGYQHMTLAPQPDRALEMVDAWYDSPYGIIRSEMNYQGTDWFYSCTVPANTTATIKLPLEAADCTVTVNGKAPEAVTLAEDGLVYVETVDNTMVFEAAAGSFSFVSSRKEVDILADAANEALQLLSGYQHTAAVTEENRAAVQTLIDKAKAAVAAYEAAGGKADALTNYGYIAGAEAALSANVSYMISKYTIDAAFKAVAGTASFAFGIKDTNNLMMWQISLTSTNARLRPHVKTAGSYGCHVTEDLSAVLGTSAEALGQTFRLRLEVDGPVIKTYLGKTTETLTLVNTYTHGEDVTLYNLGFRGSLTEMAWYDNIVVTDAGGNVLYSEDFSDPSQVTVGGTVGANKYTFVDGGIQIGQTGGAADQIYILGKPIVEASPLETAAAAAKQALQLLSGYQHTAAVTEANKADVRNLIERAKAAVAAYEAAGGSKDELDNYGYIAGAEGALAANAAYMTSKYTIDTTFKAVSGAANFAFGIKDTNNLLMWQISLTGTNVRLRPHVKTNGGYACRVTEDVGAVLGTSAEALGQTFRLRLEVDGAVVKTYLGKTAETLTLVNTYTHSENVTLYNLGFRGSYEEVAWFDNILVTDANGAVLYREDFSDPDQVAVGGTTGVNKYTFADGGIQVGQSGGAVEQIYILGKPIAEAAPEETEEAKAKQALRDLAPYQSTVSVTESNKAEVQRLIDVAKAAVEAYEAKGGQPALLTDLAFIDGAEAALVADALYQTDDFTIDLTTVVEASAQGFAFAMPDTRNFIMWQLNLTNSSATRVRPHVQVNGAWTSSTNLDITGKLGTPSDLLGKTLYERIEVNGTKIKTYLGTDPDNLILVDDTYTASAPVVLQRIGARVDTSSTKAPEIATYDNIVIRDGDGSLIYSEDFSDASKVAITGNETATAYAIENGILRLGSVSVLKEQRYLIGKASAFDAGIELAEARIDAIGTVTVDSGNVVTAARAAYDVLTEAQKAEVSNYAVLTAAEKAMDGKVQAEAVDALIDAIDLTDKATVEEARTAYDALTEEQKALVTKLEKLLNAEADLEVMESIVKLEMTGPDTAEFDPVTYTISAKEMKNLANFVMTVEYSAQLKLTAVEAVGDWVVEYHAMDGKVNIGGLHLTGASGDADLLKLTFEPVESGEAEIRVTKADLTAFTSDNELFVGKDLTNAFVQLLVNCNPYDVNRDGVINQLDLTRAQRYYGSDAPIADFNGDGRVAIDDLILLLTQILG